MCLALSLIVCVTFHSQADELPKGDITNTVGMILVSVPAGYWAGKYEVTQQEYERVMGSNPARFKAPRNPVERTSWHDAMAFCAKLRETERKAGKLPKGFAYSLPTEQQWVYLAADAKLEDAVRGRFGPNNEPLGPREVGSLKPNALGLYDTLGNVWEWCLDPYMPNNNWRVLRGGAWSVSDPDNFTTTVRLNVEPETSYEFYGFRCVLVRKP
jgi:formylglycine-generating enzyme required for sulfatase activity